MPNGYQITFTAEGVVGEACPESNTLPIEETE